MKRFEFPSFGENSEKDLEISSDEHFNKESFPLEHKSEDTTNEEVQQQIVQDLESEQELENKVENSEEDNIELNEEPEISNDQILLILNNINQIIERSNETNINFTKNLAKDLSDFSITIAKKIVKKALNDNPLAEIEIFLEDSFRFFRKESKITILLNPKMTEVIKGRIEEIFPEFIPKNNIIFEAVEDYNLYNCSVEWENGSVSVNKDEIMQRIEKYF
ncbi:MAG: FliH/SctL family protein [Alphaproteobacteria bacterium]